MTSTIGVNYYTEWGKSRATMVHIEKDEQVMIITIALLVLFCIFTTVNLLLPHPIQRRFLQQPDNTASFSLSITSCLSPEARALNLSYLWRAGELLMCP